jgi:hypothetical protein
MSSKHINCDHGVEPVMLFVPRPVAQKLRNRMAAAPEFREVNVSPLYRAGSGWAVTLCAECRADRRHSPRRKETA